MIRREILTLHPGIKVATCSQFVRHLDRAVSPALLRKNAVEFSIEAFGPGQGFLTLDNPHGTYHQEVNVGTNAALSINWEPSTAPDMPDGYVFCGTVGRCPIPGSVTEELWLRDTGAVPHAVASPESDLHEKEEDERLPETVEEEGPPEAEEEERPSVVAGEKRARGPDDDDDDDNAGPRRSKRRRAPFTWANGAPSRA